MAARVAGRPPLLLLAALAAGVPAPALAEQPPHEPRADTGRTFVYAELLGKGGPWGIGLESPLTPRLAIGTVASAAVVRDQQLYTVSPYLHATIVRRGRHALFGELGASLVHSRIPSPVPMWEGTSDTGVGGLATLGWEFTRARLGVRGYLAGALGKGGLAPFAGLALGARL